MSGNFRKGSSAFRRKRRTLMLSLQNGQCFWCDGPLTYESATLDELVPISRGGTRRLGNVVVACKRCNMRRGNMIAPNTALRRAADLVAHITG